MKKVQSTNLKPFGPGGFSHTVECWLCDKESAVYSGHPDYCFIPCWKCQKKYEGLWTKKKNWLDKLKELFKPHP